ncbi:unnamed protein product, partial [Meganyctiphanes norvegica]
MEVSSELLCCENASMDLDLTVKTYIDPVVLKDDRVLENLLKTEEQYMPSSASFFSCLQTDVKPEMREVVAHWMLQVCQEEERDEEVFTLAMNMMDRFMSLVKVGKTQLQLLGAVCLFLASKMKENPPFKPEKLAYYTHNSVTLEEIREWELLVLARLKWDLSAITPHAFLDQILERLHLNLPEHVIQMVKDHATFFIKVCTTDTATASTSASSSVAATSAVATKQQHQLQRHHQFNSSSVSSNTSCNIISCSSSNISSSHSRHSSMHSSQCSNLSRTSCNTSNNSNSGSYSSTNISSSHSRHSTAASQHGLRQQQQQQRVVPRYIYKSYMTAAHNCCRRLSRTV